MRGMRQWQQQQLGLSLCPMMSHASGATSAQKPHQGVASPCLCLWSCLIKVPCWIIPCSCWNIPCRSRRPKSANQTPKIRLRAGPFRRVQRIGLKKSESAPGRFAEFSESLSKIHSKSEKHNSKTSSKFGDN